MTGYPSTQPADRQGGCWCFALVAAAPTARAHSPLPLLRQWPDLAAGKSPSLCSAFIPPPPPSHIPSSPSVYLQSTSASPHHERCVNDLTLPTAGLPPCVLCPTTPLTTAP